MRLFSAATAPLLFFAFFGALCHRADGKLPKNGGSPSQAWKQFTSTFSNPDASSDGGLFGADNNNFSRAGPRTADQQIARDQLYTALANLAASAVSALLTFVAVKRFLAVAASAGEVLLAGMKDLAPGHWNTSLRHVRLDGRAPPPSSTSPPPVRLTQPQRDTVPAPQHYLVVARGRDPPHSRRPPLARPAGFQGIGGPLRRQNSLDRLRRRPHG